LALDLQPLDCRSDVRIFRVGVEGVRGVYLLPISLLNLYNSFDTYLSVPYTPEIPQNPSAACLSPPNIERQLSAPPNEKKIHTAYYTPGLIRNLLVSSLLRNYCDGVI
jgi:hypothetical protein